MSKLHKKFNGRLLKEKRMERNLTQPQLSELVGVSNYQYIQKWERGERNPNRQNVITLANIFKCNTYDFYIYNPEVLLQKIHEKSISVEKLQVLIGNELRQWIEGIKYPTPIQVKLLSQVLECEVDEFYIFNRSKEKNIVQEESRKNK